MTTKFWPESFERVAAPYCVGLIVLALIAMLISTGCNGHSTLGAESPAELYPVKSLRITLAIGAAPVLNNK